MKDLTTTREYYAGLDAWRQQNWIPPGYTYTWQVQAYDLGFNTARNASNQQPETFVSVGEAVANILTNTSKCDINVASVRHSIGNENMNKINVHFESARYFRIENAADRGNVVFNFLQVHRHLFKTMRVSPVATAYILETERLPRFMEYAKSKGIEVVQIH